MSPKGLDRHYQGEESISSLSRAGTNVSRCFVEAFGVRSPHLDDEAARKAPRSIPFTTPPQEAVPMRPKKIRPTPVPKVVLDLQVLEERLPVSEEIALVLPQGRPPTPAPAKKASRRRSRPRSRRHP
jgi:hypothetical protein